MGTLGTRTGTSGTQSQPLKLRDPRGHVPLPFECADPETVISARHPGVCQEVASLLLGLTGETLTLNRSHTPTRRSREYFTLRSIGDRGRPLYRLSMHIGCTGVSPSSQYIYKCGHTSFTLCGPPRYAPFTLCGSARCSAGQPVAIQHFFLLCESARCAYFFFCVLRVGPLLIFYTLRVSPLKSFSFCGSARPTSFVFCGSARHCVVGDHVNYNFLFENMVRFICKLSS